jgi:hypothetical protein
MALSAYLDASILVSLFAPDSLAGPAEALLRQDLPEFLVSNFAGAEFASARRAGSE